MPLPSSSLPSTATTSSAEADAPFKLSVLLVYENVSAALWAVERLGGVLRELSPGQPPPVSPWSFATLRNPSFRRHAAAAGVRASLIAVATSSAATRLPDFVESWLGECLLGRHHPATAVIALLGDAHLLDGADSPRLQAVRQLATEHGCGFFSPGLAETALGTG